MDVPSRPRMDRFAGASLYQIAFLFRLFLAEAIGLGTIVYALVLYSPASQVPGAILAGIAFTWTVGVIGPISGAQINPAVTISLMLTRRVSFVHGIFIIGGQLTGSTLGTLFAKLLGPEILRQTPNLGMTLPSPDVTIGQAFLLEMIGTAMLVGSVLSVSDEFRDKPWSQGHVTIFPFFFGVTISLMAITIGPYTGASLNPARSLGPAFVNHVYVFQWLYVVAPITGAFISVLLYDVLLTDGASIWRLKAWFSRSDFERTANYKQLKRSHHTQSAEA